MIEVLKGIIALIFGGLVLFVGLYSILSVSVILYFFCCEFLKWCLDFFISNKEVHKVELMPIHPRARHRCPFYGFHFFGYLETFIDSMGNQCAANLDAYGPCQMEWKGDAPNWSECPFNKQENQKRFESIKDSCKVFPKEFGPDGLSFGQWLDYVMSQKPESVRRD